MEDLKIIISKKLVCLRQKKGMTQLEVAEILNYSDKAISKWEHGESLPGIEVLYNLAQLYEVSLDYLTHEGEYIPQHKTVSKNDINNRIIIVLLAISAVWCMATAIFIYTQMFLHIKYWQVFIWAICPSCIIAFVFNAFWGKRIFAFYIVSILMWSVLAGVYFQMFQLNLWAIFILGAPMQISIILWARLK